MKHLNFSTKSGSQSRSHSIVTLCTTVGSPSVHRRGTLLKHVAFLLLFLFSFGVGNAWANYTITFKTSGSSSDGSGAQTTIANLISDGGDYVNSISASRAYNGKDGTGVKLGYGSGGGNVEMTMKSSGTNIGQIKATKLVVTATQYSNTENNLKVTVTYTTGSTPTEETLTLSSTSTPYDVTLDATKTIQKIKIETNSTKKRAYCASIQVVEASSKTLSSISVSTAPKTEYLAGEMFNPAGLVITRTYSDKTTDTYTYAGHTSDFTFSPTTATALATSHTSVTITYGGKSTSQDINVYDVTMQARDEASGTISSGPGAPSRTGTSISPAADANNYVFKEWQIDGATLGSSNTTKSNTITNPTKAVMVTAVYYKPITITYKANGTTFTTQTYGYGGTLAFPSPNPNGATYSCTGKTFVGWVAEANKDYSHASNAPTYATAGGSVTEAATYYAVFADASVGTGSSTGGITNAEIETAGDGKTAGSYTNQSASSASGNWTGKYAFNTQVSEKVMQINATSGNSIISPTFPGNITGITLVYTSNSGSNKSFYIKNGETTLATLTATANAQKGSVSNNSISGSYTDFVITANNALYIHSITVTYSGGTSYSNYATTCCSDPGLAYGTSPVAKTFGDAKFTKELTNSHSVAVTYASNAPSVATVDENGEVTISGAGSATITASSIQQTVSSVKYCADEASYTLNVAKAAISPTLTYSSNSLTVGSTSAAPTVGGNTGNGAVSYSSSNTSVATVSSTGVVTAKAVGSATITATIAATTNYNGNTATADFTITPSGNCATPSFSPVEGTYSTAQSVTISCATDDATIYYTTDGNDPEAIPANLYTEPIAVSANTTIKALAVKGGMNNSEIGTAVYGIRCAQPSFSQEEGTYNVEQSVTLSAGEGATIYYTTDGNDPEAIPANLYTEPIDVSANTTIKAIAIVDGMTESEVASAGYVLQCLAPTFTPGEGALTGAQAITLSCTTEGATIRYTTNNAEPTGSSPEYTEPIQVATATTIKAKAFKDGWTASDLATAEYTVKYTVTLNAGTGSVSDAGWTQNQGVYTKTQANAGDALTLPNATLPSNLTDAGWTFAGWKVSSVDAETTAEQSFVSTPYTPTSDITLYAVYKRTATGEEMEFARYEEVTSAPTDWSGKYLLSTGSYTATGVINSSHLTCTALVPGATVQTSYEFTLAKVGDAGYSILLPNGTEYLGYNSGTNFKTSTSAPQTTNTDLLWSPSTSEIANVSASVRKIASNAESATDFRPYQNLNSGATWVKLYKRIEEAASVTYYHSTPCVALGEFSGSVPQASAEQNQVVLQWTNLSGVTDWSVTYRVKNTGDYATVTPSATAVVEGNNQWTITGLSTATDYQFKIHADAFGAGYCSNVDEWDVEGRTAEAYTITAQSNNETYGTVVLNNNVITGTPNTNYRYATPAYTVTSGTATVVRGTGENINKFTVTPTSSCTVLINFEAIPSHTVTWVENDNSTDESYLEGATIEFPASASGCANKVFKGWLGVEIVGEVDEEPTYVTAATMGTQDLTYHAVFAKETKGTSTTTNDELTRATTGVTSGSTNYSGWSGETVTSDAVYAGSSAGDHDAIQLRSTNSSGIITTTSGGKATKVTVVWEGNTTSGRTLNIYGKNTAYSAASDLYGDNAGTLLGSIVKGTSTELTITGDYEYIGMRSNSGAMYLSSITIEWTNTEPSTYDKYATACTPQVATPTFSGVEANEDCSEVKSVTICCTTPGATIYYTTDGTTPSTNSTEYTTPITLTGGTHTIQAIAVLENYDDSEVASISFTQPYVSIADFIANGSTTDAKKLVLTGAVVLGKSGKNIYVQDATGGIILYNSTASNVPAWASGKAISGYVVGKKGSYQDMPEVTECVFANASATEDGTPTPKTITAATDADLCQLVKIEGVNFQSTALSSSAVIVNKGETPWTIYDSFNKLSETLPNSATDCDVTGVLTKHDNVYQISPISVDGITTKGALAILPTLSTTGSTNSENPTAVAEGKVITVSPAAGMTSTYKDGTADVADLTSATNVTITAGSDKAIQVTASAYYYTDNSATYYYHPDPTLTEYEISTADMTKGSVTVKKGEDVVGSATFGATITLYPAPTEHYHLTDISVVDASSNEVSLTTVVENEQYTFTMPAKAVTVSATFAEDAYATVTFDKGTEAATGTAPSSFKKYVGQTATMPANTFALSGNSFIGWKYGDDTYDVGATYTILAKDAAEGGKTITFEAQWEPYPWAGNGKWELVTDASSLAANDYIIIASASDETALGAKNNSYRNAESITRNIDKSAITNIGNATVLQLKAGTEDNSFAFLDVVANNYLATSNSSSNDMGTSTTIVAIASWAISLDAENVATVEAYGDYSRKSLRANNSPARYSCYATTSLLPKLMLYRFIEGNFFTITYAKGTDDEVSNMPTAQVTESDGSATLSNETPIYVGYTFLGWKDQDNNEYQPGDDVTLTKDVTLTAQWEEATPHSLSYDLNGGTIKSGTVPSSTNYYPDAVVTITDAVLENGDLLFVGWTYKGDTYGAGSSFTMPNEDVVLKAKFANGAMYTIESKTEVSATGEPEGADITKSYGQTYNTAGQATGNNSMTLSLSGYTGYTIKSVIMNMKSNGSSGTGTLSVSIGGNEVANQSNADRWFGVNSFYTSSYTDINVSMEPTFVKSGQSIVIEIAATQNSLYCTSFTIEYEKSVEISGDDIDFDDILAGSDVVIGNSGVMEVETDKTLHDVTIQSTSGAFEVDGTSGQLSGSGTLTVSGGLYLEIKLRSDAMDEEASRKWYCISAPFDVAINGGFFWGDGTPMVLNTHFQLFEWDGDRRATGASGWRRTSSDMQAGVAYFIGFDDARSNQNTIKLKAMSNTISNVDEITAPGHSGSAEAATYGNWNGLGNPNFHHIALNKNVQAFDYNEQHYNAYATDEYNFVVGTPFFIQYAGTIGIEDLNDGKPFRAPKREGENYSYCVRIGRAEASRADNQIYVRASETASAEFDNERDMITLNGTTSNYGALLWTKNYGGKRLAIEEAPLVNNKASYELGIFAPTAGSYSISVAAPQENAELYLTKNGHIIWNLTMSPCELELTQGQNEGYGLILRANAPSTATGVDEVQSDNVQCTKVVIDDHVYILRGGKMYGVDGKEVR